MKPAHIFLAASVMAAWGINFVIIRIGLDNFPPILLSTLRFGLAGLPLIFIWKTRPAPLHWIVAIALCLGIFKFSLLFVGMDLGAGAGLSSLVLQMQAFFTVLLAFFLLDERPSKRQMAGMGLAFIGLGIILADQYGGRSAFIGIAFVVVAALFWALSNLSMKKAQSSNPLHLMIWVSAFSTPVLLGISWGYEGGDAIINAFEQISFSGITSVFYLAFIATLAGFGIWAYLLKTYDAGQVAPFSLLVPIFGMTSSALVLGETITINSLVAAGFIITGLYFNTMPAGSFLKRRKTLPC
ncbi:EamA family transporter [Terasakiella sp. A23]|uniref:EamA family transporter n=1 Tax=Terasakiella sp. FCG-A23 TaxID=3080561 RepID=UPI002953EB42|nr:EamA family transporter [Terasakiella sp. A23]MDV7338982.1 EamA family transporter [Terasakiella sp. A23]